MMVSQLLVEVPAGRGLLPELFAVLALAVLIYGLRDAWRGVRQWLTGSGGDADEPAGPDASAAEAQAPGELLTQLAASEAALPREPAIASGAPTGASPSARAAGIIARALTDAQLIISAEQAPRAQQDAHEVADALGRFEAILARIADRTDQLSLRIASLTEAVSTLATHAHAAPPSAAAPPAPTEPSFEPDAQGIDLVVAGTPGFQALMEIQHALARLPQAQSASVLRYEHDEAEFHLVLSQAMTAAAIAEAVGTGGERRPLIETAAPDARQLRLRFAAV
jgi:hypothetical protein